jgi:hypothetical protein
MPSPTRAVDLFVLKLRRYDNKATSTTEDNHCAVMVRNAVRLMTSCWERVPQPMMGAIHLVGSRRRMSVLGFWNVRNPGDRVSPFLSSRTFWGILMMK